MENEKLQRTHCWYCQKETNHKVLLDEFDTISEEIIWRTEEGDESKSAWAVVGSIWLVSKCLGCDKITFKHVYRATPDKEFDQIFHFPKKIVREFPKWTVKLPIKYSGVFYEVYVSIQEGLYILALTGTRILLDLFIVSKIGDDGTFKQKMDKLVLAGIITSSKAKVLKTAIDAANASAHRGYKPDKETLFQILDIVENLLQSEIVDRPIDEIRKKTPSRSK
jgi:uncharacterized protein YutE (UPF0331/DUF86 family)